MGLIHDIAPTGALNSIVEGYMRDILQAAPNALAATKKLLFDVARAETLEETRQRRVGLLSELRSSDEGREGMAAFAEKRKPKWVPNEDEGITL
jgi:methylglutaconyl-CoA hydratase